MPKHADASGINDNGISMLKQACSGWYSQLLKLSSQRLERAQNWSASFLTFFFSIALEISSLGWYLLIDVIMMANKKAQFVTLVSPSIWSLLKPVSLLNLLYLQMAEVQVSKYGSFCANNNINNNNNTTDYITPCTWARDNYGYKYYLIMLVQIQLLPVVSVWHPGAHWPLSGMRFLTTVTLLLCLYSTRSMLLTVDHAQGGFLIHLQFAREQELWIVVILLLKRSWSVGVLLDFLIASQFMSMMRYQVNP